MIKISSGLRNALATDYGLGIMMNGGMIQVYGGVQPATPDYAPGTPLLGKITTDGKVFVPTSDPNNAGLLLSLVPPGGLTNNGIWRLKGEVSGTAVWFRWVWKFEDSGLDSAYYPRVDGVVGEDLILKTTQISPSTDKEIEVFLIQIPI